MHSNQVSIALAQVPVRDSDIQYNLKQHILAIQQAAKHGADLVVFPELSLTGYDLANASANAVDKRSDEIRQLSELVVAKQIIAMVGCPVKNPVGKPYISMAICLPTGEVEFYSKQYLHTGEENHVSSGLSNGFLRLNGYKLALSICADFSDPEHTKDAHEAEADLYISSALISPNGYESDSSILSTTAQRYQMPVMLANHISQTGGWDTAGKSAMWAQNGEQVACANSQQAQLLICQIEGTLVESKLIELQLEGAQ